MKRPSTSDGILSTREYVKRLLIAFGIGVLVGSLLTVWALIALGRL